jgi:anti-sigma B factor antagonist
MGNFEVLNSAPRIFELRGELDMATAPCLLDAMARVLHEPGDVLFDLSALSFVDASGLHAIVQIADPLSDGSLLLAGSQRIVKRALEITGLDSHGNIRVMGQHSLLPEEMIATT